MPILDGGGNPVRDDEGHPTYTTTSTSGIRCLFLWREVENTTDQGTVIEKTPELYVDNDQAIREGDLIQTVLARNGTTVLLNTAKVKTIDDTAEGGSEALKVCTLEGASV